MISQHFLDSKVSIISGQLLTASGPVVGDIPFVQTCSNKKAGVLPTLFTLRSTQPQKQPYKHPQAAKPLLLIAADQGRVRTAGGCAAVQDQINFCAQALLDLSSSGLQWQIGDRPRFPLLLWIAVYSTHAKTFTNHNPVRKAS